MRRYLFYAAVVLVLLTACGGGGGSLPTINDPQYMPAPLELGDYDYLLGAKPVIRMRDFSTCPGTDPISYSELETCLNHVTSQNEFFPERSVVPYIGPLRAWRADDPDQYYCDLFEFSLTPIAGSEPKSLQLGLHPDTAANVWSNEAALMGKRSWGSVYADGLSFTHTGVGDTTNCFHMLRARYAAGIVFDSLNLHMRDGIVQIGRVSDLVGSAAVLYNWTQRGADVEVVSGKKVLVGFNQNDPEAQQTTTNFQATLYACLDEDENGECDFRPGETCWSLGGDYLRDKCCGFDVDVPVCAYLSAFSAYCANTTTGDYRWLAHDLPGMIVPIGGSCNTFDAVSNGSNYFVCGSNESIDQSTVYMPDDSIATITKGGETHHFACANSKITECGGKNPFSEVQYINSGDNIALGNATHYCTDQGILSISLDNSEAACYAAGLEWTGTKCCGEVDDPLTTYDDFGLDSRGVCVDNQFIANGQVLTNNSSVLTYFGVFVSCDPSKPGDYFDRASYDLFPGIKPFEHGVCGTFLANASFDEHAVCTPQATWDLKQASEYQFVKNISWSRAQGQYERGCCATNECWTGTDCIKQNDYYSVSGEGFRCQ